MPITPDEIVNKQGLFWSKVFQPSPYSCWEWEGGVIPDGYGLFRFEDHHQLVHRLAYRWLVGEVPNGLELDHLCRNRICVNPLHLEAVTHRINLLRGRSLAAQNARKIDCKRGHPLSGENLWTHNGQRLCRECRRAATRRWREARHAA